MERTIRPARRLVGQLTVPGDKSISHRALLLSAIARGSSEISGLAPGADLASTANCLRALGVVITQAGRRVLVEGRGLRGLRAPVGTLDAGNFGTAMRLLTGLLAGQPFESIISGDESLRRRPMERIIRPLAQMGARIESRSGRPPLLIRGGPLHGISYKLPVASAQLKSCLLLAGLYAQGRTQIIETQPTRNHTERMLRRLGVPLEISDNCLTLSGPLADDLPACDWPIPGDLSSAAFFIAAAALLPGSDLHLANIGVNPTRTGFLTALCDMGAQIELLQERQPAGEPLAELRVRGAARLQAIKLAGPAIPALIDELPLLAVVATQAQGTTVIEDAAELRVKESDRLAAVAKNLRRMGAELEERPDGLIIPGPQPLRGARLSSYNDHRIAMAFAIAGLIATGKTVISGAEWADISFPNFYRQLETLRDD